MDLKFDAKTLVKFLAINTINSSYASDDRLHNMTYVSIATSPSTGKRPVWYAVFKGVGIDRLYYKPAFFKKIFDKRDTKMPIYFKVCNDHDVSA